MLCGDRNGQPAGGRPKARRGLWQVAIPAKESHDVARWGPARRQPECRADRPAGRAASTDSRPPFVPFLPEPLGELDLSPNLLNIRIGRHGGILPHGPSPGLAPPDNPAADAVGASNPGPVTAIESHAMGLTTPAPAPFGMMERTGRQIT